MAEAQSNEEKINMLSEALLEHIANVDEKINEAVMGIADNVEDLIRGIVREELEKMNNAE